MARRVLEYGVILEWNESQVREFLREPRGTLAKDLMEALGQVVEQGAKKRALYRTGRMQEAITHRVGADSESLYADIISPVQDRRTGFPYATVHEGRKVRDRRPHRSLRPALRDIRRIEYMEPGPTSAADALDPPGGGSLQRAQNVRVQRAGTVVTQARQTVRQQRAWASVARKRGL
jgi:hypothetical protein